MRIKRKKQMRKRQWSQRKIVLILLIGVIIFSACNNGTLVGEGDGQQGRTIEGNGEELERPAEAEEDLQGTIEDLIEMTEEPGEEQIGEEFLEAEGISIFRVAVPGVEGRFNPLTASNKYDAYINSLLFDSLITSDGQGQPIPLLATWEMSEDYLTYTFFLDERATFSDGVLITAYDVEFTYQITAHPDYDGPHEYMMGNIAEIVVIDERTIAFTMQQAHPANIWHFTHGIIPTHHYGFNRWDEFVRMEGAPIGSGRFVFAEYAPLEFVRLERNPYHWNPERIAQVDEILLVKIEEGMLADVFTTEQIHLAWLSATLDNYETFSEMGGLSLEVVPHLSYEYLQFNTLRPTLADVRVRQALLYALDRQLYIDTVLGPFGSLNLSGFFIDKSWVYPYEIELNQYSFDLRQAVELLEEAGWLMGEDGVRVRHGIPLELIWPVYTEVPWVGRLAEMARDSWGQLGVEVIIEEMSFTSVQGRTTAPNPGEKDFCVVAKGFSLGMDPDLSTSIFDFNEFRAGGFNASGFFHHRAQELVLQGRGEFNQDIRREIYAEWAIILNYYLPSVIIANRSELWVVADGIYGVTMNAFQDWTEYAHLIRIIRR